VRPQGLSQAPGAKAQFSMRMTHEATRPTGPSFQIMRCNSGVSSSRTSAVSSTVPGVTKPRRNRRTSGRSSAACLRASGTIVAHSGTSGSSLLPSPESHAFMRRSRAGPTAPSENRHLRGDRAAGCRRRPGRARSRCAAAAHPQLAGVDLSVQAGQCGPNPREACTTWTLAYHLAPRRARPRDRSRSPARSTR